MTELEQPRPFSPSPAAGASSAPQSHESVAASLASSRKSNRFRRLIEHSWIHLLLLSLIGLFLFPCAYMVATSLKTDEELTEPDWLPAIPIFQGESPRIRR